MICTISLILLASLSQALGLGKNVLLELEMTRIKATQFSLAARSCITHFLQTLGDILTKKVQATKETGSCC
jgi:hypothetical protein